MPTTLSVTEYILVTEEFRRAPGEVADFVVEVRSDELSNFVIEYTRYTRKKSHTSVANSVQLWLREESYTSKFLRKNVKNTVLKFYWRAINTVMKTQILTSQEANNYTQRTARSEHRGDEHKNFLCPSIRMVFYIKTYGCQMNVYDSERISELLEAAGMRPLPPNDTKNNADVIILNTCNIRDKAEHKVYTELGFLKKIKNERAAAGKQTIIAVGGCVAQAEGDNILRRAPFVNLVFGTQRFCEIADALSELFAELQNQATGNEPQKQLLNLQSIAPIELKTRASTSGPHSQANPHKTAAFVAIQEGCDKFCTYCVVPHTRGQEVSRDAESVLAEVLALSSAGVKEITLLGQNVNAYHGAAPAADGSAMATWDLARLLHAVGQISGVERIFYGTSHPRDVNEALAQAHASIHTLMPFIHLPVQSGSDRVLKRMNRKYTVQQYLDIVELFRKHTPNIAFSSDFIVGFPGESEDDFEQTLELVRKVEYAQAFSFKYSPRPRTPASTMPDQIPEKVKKERLARLQDLLQQQQINFNNSCVGKTLSVMFQRLGKSERQVLGKSEYMQSVVVSGVQPDAFMHKICIVKIERASLSCLEGSIVSPEKSSN